MYEDAEGNMQQFVLYDNIAEFIETFEDAKEKKKKAKTKGLEKFLDAEEIISEDDLKE
jgi:inorganic pyrophosphatase